MRSMTTGRPRRRNQAVRAHTEVTIDAVDVHLTLPSTPMILTNPKELLLQQRSKPFGVLPILQLLELQTKSRLQFIPNKTMRKKKHAKSLQNRMNLLQNNVWITRIWENSQRFTIFLGGENQRKRDKREQKLGMWWWFWNL